MPTVTLTLTTDKGIARPSEMRAALISLIAAGLLPSTGLKITFSVATNDDALNLEDLLTVAFESRSWVVDAEIEIKSKRGLERRAVDRADIPTPMETYLEQQIA